MKQFTTRCRLPEKKNIKIEGVTRLMTKKDAAAVLKVFN